MEFFLNRNKFKVPQSRIDRNFVALILFYFYFTSKSSSQILENLNCHGWIFDFSDLSNVRKGYLFRRRIQSSKILKKDRLQKSQILIIPSNNSKFQNSQIYIEKGKFHDFDNPGIFSTPSRSSHRYIYSKEVQQVLKKRIGNHCASQGVRWERGKPRSRFQAIREICLRRNARSQRRFPLFTYAGSSDRKIIIRRFLQLWTKPFACVSGVYIHMYICIQSSCVGKSSSVIFSPPLPPLGAPITLSLSHSRACRVGCVRIAFRCAFTGG